MLCTLQLQSSAQWKNPSTNYQLNTCDKELNCLFHSCPYSVVRHTFERVVSLVIQLYIKYAAGASAFHQLTVTVQRVFYNLRLGSGVASEDCAVPPTEVPTARGIAKVR